MSKSPFPGMDPYIEATGDWMEFHNRFMTYCCDALNERLPTGYIASLDVRLKLVRSDDEQTTTGRLRPDLGVHHRSGGAAPAPPASTGGAVATLEPETRTLPVDYDEVRESAIRIVRYPDRELVTHIELLSPSNKRNTGRGEYDAKRGALLQKKVNLVEIDLLLAGERLETVEPLPPGDYYVLVSRAERRPQCEVYAWSIRRPLPPIPVPLMRPDPDVWLDLGSVFNQAHARGRYAELLRYGTPLVGLADPDLAWAADVARSPAARTSAAPPA